MQFPGPVTDGHVSGSPKDIVSKTRHYPQSNLEPAADRWSPARRTTSGPKAVLAMGIALLLLALTPGATNACTCNGPAHPAVAVEQSDAVFLGRVLFVAYGDHDTQVDCLELRGGTQARFESDLLIACIRVDHAIKGTSEASTVKVTTASHGPACGASLRLGEDYILYAAERREGAFRTSSCTRTSIVSEANTDLEFLGIQRSPPDTGEAPESGSGNRNSPVDRRHAIHCG